MNLPPAQQRDFFGRGGRRELDLVFNFHAMQAMYLALARQDATPLEEAMDRLPRSPRTASGRRSCAPRRAHPRPARRRSEEVFAAFGPSEDMQLYGRGLRRRLPTMLAGDQARIRLVYSLAFSLPRTPVLFYGEEIGMGENDIPGRLSVRCSGRPSPTAASRRPTRSTDPVPPADDDEGFDPAAVNGLAAAGRGLAAQLVRAAHPPPQGVPRARLGRFQRCSRPRSGPFAHRSDWDDRAIVAVHNLSGDPVATSFTLDDGERIEALGTFHHARSSVLRPTGASSSTSSPTRTAGSACRTGQRLAL